MDQELVADVGPSKGMAEVGDALHYQDEACTGIEMRRFAVPHNNTSAKCPPDIARWLAKPAQVLTGDLPSAVGSTITWDYTATNILAVPHWADKLSEHLAIRSTACITVNISATPFQDGVLRAFVQPSILAYPGVAGNWVRTSRAATFTMPGKYINLSESTQYCIRVPWLGNVPFLELTPGLPANSDIKAPFQFVLRNYTSITPPAGATAPTYSIYVHHEDVELLGPIASSWSTVQPQGVMQMVEDLRQSKAISKVLAESAKYTTVLGNIPILPKGFSTAGWVLRKAAFAASMLGFSRPMTNEPMKRIVTYPLCNVNNTSGDDFATNLGIFHDSAVADVEGAGTAMDEQSVGFIAAQPGLIADVNVNLQVGGTLVYACALAPSAMFYQAGRFNAPIKDVQATISTAPFPSFSPSPVFGVASLAGYWRGGFKFHFEFSKTKFHAGRLAFVFVPGQHDGIYNTVRGATGYQFPPYASTFDLTRKIVDLREATSVDFEVPFVSTESMLPQQSPYGFVCVYVVERVKSPTTVNAGLQMLVDVASPDLRLAGLVGTTYGPTNNPNNVFAQGTLAPPERVLADFGEELTSLNALCKRTCFRTTASGVSTVRPFSANLPVYTPNGTAPTACSIANQDVIDFVRSAYRFERGGMIVTAHPLGIRTELTTIPFQGTGTTVGSTVDRFLFNGQDAAYSVNTTNPVARAYVPRQSPYTYFKTDEGGIASEPIASREVGRVAPVVTTAQYNSVDAGIAHRFGRSVGDDHRFAMFIGWPSLVRGAYV